MRILQRYIIHQILVVFVACLIVFTFVLFVGNMLKIIELMSKGIKATTIIQFLILLLPFMLAYSIPISILTSVLLVFARLSADNEITAIRSGGINLKYIFTPVIITACILVALCYWINDSLRPNSIFTGRKLLLEIGIEEPIVHIPTGRFTELFPDYMVYIGQKEGKTMKRMVVYKFEEEKLDSVITAGRGQLLYGKKKSETLDKEDHENVYLKLYDGVIEKIPAEGQTPAQVNRIEFGTYIIEFNLQGQLQNLSQMGKKEREMTNRELSKRIKDYRKRIKQAGQTTWSANLKQDISSIRTRIHNRLAMSFSCLVFVLIGIPLGIRVHRSETSIGAGISLMLIAGYYFMMTLGEAFQENPSLHPWLFMWIPNLILLTISITLIHKMLKK